ncbi:hypothetical protein QR680_012777 [Steinernema hermaphroditum]|uniref:Ribosome biogenesis protein BRX1 homolog n=1 Tax=Steinernema hermaphroditum TaxID=289476 RepID=A0AA39M0E0_9BILA|nr:hypothetical protein QR680_012777 [Steinernema hermaphroditum]
MAEREKVLVFCSRGSDYRTRHVMNDLKTIMPHSRGESKMSKKTSITMINEIASMAKCTKCIYFESRKKKDVYMWLTNVEDGPSVKFLVHNIHTMEELRLTGNCLKASRPVLSFGSEFDVQPSSRVIKELLKQTFATPNHHPRSQPFIDHIFSFSMTPDGKIWFRNFQVVDEKMELQEIGPRMVLEIATVFAGSFEGAVLYENPNYVNPNAVRRQMKLAQRNKYVNRKMTEEGRKEKDEKLQQIKLPDLVGEEFDTNRKVTDEKALEIMKAIDTKLARPKKSKTKKARLG